MPTITESFPCAPCCTNTPTNPTVYPICCPIAKGIPARLYMTIFDDEGLCPCINGQTFILDYTEGIYIAGVPGGLLNGWIIRPPCELPAQPNTPENPYPYQCYDCIDDTNICINGAGPFGGPYTNCPETAKIITRINRWRNGFSEATYYGPAFVCYEYGEPTGIFNYKNFYFMWKFYHQYLPLGASCFGNFCNGEDDNGFALYAQRNPLAYADEGNNCDSPFYRDFIVNNLYNMETNAGYSFLNWWINVLNCSTYGTLRVAISE